MTYLTHKTLCFCSVRCWSFGRLISCVNNCVVVGCQPDLNRVRGLARPENRQNASKTSRCQLSQLRGRCLSFRGIRTCRRAMEIPGTVENAKTVNLARFMHSIKGWLKRDLVLSASCSQSEILNTAFLQAHRRTSLRFWHLNRNQPIFTKNPNNRTFGRSYERVKGRKVIAAFTSERKSYPICLNLILQLLVCRMHF